MAKNAPPPQEQELTERGYVPSDHRLVSRPTNYCETLVHMLKASIGTGIMAMPKAFSKSGYITGIIGTIMVGVLCTYCMRILVKVQYELCIRNQVPSMSYTETARYASLAGPKKCTSEKCLPLFSNLFVLGFQIGASCIYLIFVSDNIKAVLEYYAKFDVDHRIYFIAVLVPVLLTATINNLKFLSILSFMANVTTIAGFLIVFYFIFEDINKFNENLVNRSKFGQLYYYPFFTSVVVFSMEAIGVVMVLENEMKKPLQFTSLFGVLNMAMIPTILLYTLVGLTGFVKYGETVCDSITLSLPSENYLAQASKLLFSFGIFATYILALFVAYDIIWKSYIQPKYEFEPHTWRTWGYQYLLRVLLIILTWILATIIPNLGLFISLVGALCLATSGIAFPALFNLFTYWEDYTGVKSFLLNCWYMIIIIIGVVICIVGLTLSSIDIVKTFTEPSRESGC